MTRPRGLAVALASAACAVLVLVGPFGERRAHAQCDPGGSSCDNDFPVIVGPFEGGSPTGLGGTSAGTPGNNYKGPEAPEHYWIYGFGQRVAESLGLDKAAVVVPVVQQNANPTGQAPTAQKFAAEGSRGILSTAREKYLPNGKPKTTPQTTAPTAPSGYGGDEVAGTDSENTPSDPVDHGRGEFLLKNVDLEFPGFGVPFVLRRTYRSRLDFEGSMGAQWSHSYDLRLVPSPVEGCEESLLYTVGDGTTIEFTPGLRVGAEQTYAAPAGVHLELRGHFLSEFLIGYTLKHPSGVRATFGADGSITSLRDLNDQGLTFAWRGQRLETVVDSVGRVITFEHDEADRIVRVVELVSGMASSYVYDDATGDLLQATDSRGRSEVYEYAAGSDVRSEEFIPEAFLRPACEQACAPSASSCHAGGACETFPALALADCQAGCLDCVGTCTDGCATNCEAGRATCLNGTAAEPGCHASCEPTCAAAAPSMCVEAWNTAPMADALGVAYSPKQACQRAVNQSLCGTQWSCESNGNCQPVADLQCKACKDGDPLLIDFHDADCGCSERGIKQMCEDGFFGVQPGTCGCDPAAGNCPTPGAYHESLGGCIPHLAEQCTALCDDHCTNKCVDNCKFDCPVECIEQCNPLVCGAECGAFDFAGYCADNCVEECVETSHAFSNSHTGETHSPPGPKYGYPADLAHNLVKVFNADGSLRLENIYGQDIGQPSFDAVVQQKTGTQVIGLGYAELTATPPNYESAELCPSVCVRASVLEPVFYDYVPTPDGLVVLPRVPGLPSYARAGGFESSLRGGQPLPLALFPVTAGAGPSLTTAAIVVGRGTLSMLPPGQVVSLSAPEGGSPLLMLRNANDTLTLTGAPPVLDKFRAAGHVTLFSDTRGALHVYPGQPRALVHVAAGTCTQPFRAQVNAAGQLEMNPPGACAADLSVVPLGSLVTDAQARVAFLATGSKALETADLFAPSALTAGRWLARWREVPGLPGRYELSVGAGEGAAPSSLTSRIASATARSPVLRGVTASEPASRPFYVLHLPKTLRTTETGASLALDQIGPFDPGELRKDCVSFAIGEPRRGLGPDGPGPHPARVTTVTDAYGVAWLFYYDKEGRQIRAVNQGTGAIRSFNHDASSRLTAAEDPLRARSCLRHDGSGSLVAATHYPAPFSAGEATPIRERFEYQAQPVRLAKQFDPRDPTRVLASYTWDLKGNLTSAKDALGHTTTYTPSAYGPAEVATSPGGIATTYAWDGLTGTLGKLTLNPQDESPVSITTAHDVAGRPTHQTLPLGDKRQWKWNGPVLEAAVQNADGVEHAVTFVYDEDHRVKEFSTPRYRVDQVRDLFGRVVRRVASAKDGSAETSVTCSRLGFDGRLLEQVLPEGARVRPQYDGEGRVVTVLMGYLLPDPAATWDDGCAQPPAGTAAESFALGETHYDLAGRVFFAKDAFGAETRVTYDGFHRALVVRDEENRTLRQGYDAAGRVLWRAAYDASASAWPYQRPALADPGLLAVVEFHYDATGLLQKRDMWHFDANRTPIGDGLATTTYAYDVPLNTVTVTDDAGFATTHRYDGAGREVESILPSGDGVSTRYANGGRTVIEEWSAPTPEGVAGQTTQLNAWGAPLSVAAKHQDAAPVLRTWSYDNKERYLRKTFGPSGLDRQLVVDAFGRVVVATSFFDPAGNEERVTYRYDRAGRLLDHESRLGAAPTPATTSFRYDALGRVESVTRPNGGTESLLYYGASDLVARVDDPREVVWIYDYFPTGELAGVAAVPPEGEAQARARRFNYDGLGRLTEARDKGASYANPADDIVTTLRWDSLGGKSLEWDTSTGLPHAVSHVHDGRGLPQASNLGPFAVTRTFDTLGRQDQIKAGSTVLASFTYDGLGGPISRSLASGVTSSFTYDRLGRLEGITEARGATALAAWRYELPLDGVPRLAGLKKGTAPEVASLYVVDRAARLLGEEHGRTGLGGLTVEPTASPTAGQAGVLGAFGDGPSWRTYALDGRSNWTARDASDPALTTDPTLNAFDGYESFGGLEAGFDPSGNLTDLGQEHYEFDAFGEVTLASRGEETRRFTYDALGRRVRETDPATGAITRFTFDGVRRVAQVNPNGSWLVAVDGAGLDEHIALVASSGQRSYLHQDRMRSVYLVTDSGGNPVEWTSYTAFGEASLTDALGNPLAASQVGNRFGFQGQPSSPALGLVDMRARLYRPDWGRFISPDPIGLAGGPNLYAFVGSAPLMWWDPMGLGSQTLDAGMPDASEPIDPSEDVNHTMSTVAPTPPGPVERGLDYVVGFTADTIAGGFNGLFQGSMTRDGSAAFGHNRAFATAQIMTGSLAQALFHAANILPGAASGGGLGPSSGGATVVAPATPMPIMAPAGAIPGQRAVAEGVDMLREGDDEPEGGAPEGGAYKEVPAKGGEVNHAPADSVSPLPRGAGPGFRMERLDHYQTSSWGSSRLAKAYRELQYKLIQAGRFDEAMDLDIMEAKALFGGKYDVGIEQMLEYTLKLRDKYPSLFDGIGKKP